jgi:septal ring factor EnvC (AmiA/AmiB activator)
MTRSHKVLGFLLVAILGIYGCAKTPGVGGDTRLAETKVQRLEEDFRAATTARDSYREQLAQAQQRQVDLQRRLDLATAATAAERTAKDAARAELRARTTERDNLQTQYDGFRRTIRDLIGQADAALANPTAPLPAFVGGPGLHTPTAVTN